MPIPKKTEVKKEEVKIEVQMPSGEVAEVPEIVEAEKTPDVPKVKEASLPKDNKSIIEKIIKSELAFLKFQDEDIPKVCEEMLVKYNELQKEIMINRQGVPLTVDDNVYIHNTVGATHDSKLKPYQRKAIMGAIKDLLKKLGRSKG